MEPHYRNILKSKSSGTPVEDIFRLNNEAIDRADLVIVEGSYKSFGNGFQAATALQKKKPLLLLIRRGSDESTISRSAVDPYLIRKEYDDTSLDKIVKDFIQNNTMRTKDMRFNFVADRATSSHLRWLSYKSGKTKAEVLRNLILEDIRKSDD